MAQDYINMLQNNKTVFITGATGLVGCCLIKKLSAQNIQIKALYRTEIPFKSSNI